MHFSIAPLHWLIAVVIAWPRVKRFSVVHFCVWILGLHDIVPSSDLWHFRSLTVLNHSCSCCVTTSLMLLNYWTSVHCTLVEALQDIAPLLQLCLLTNDMAGIASTIHAFSGNTRHRNNVGRTLGQCIVFAGLLHCWTSLFWLQDLQGITGAPLALAFFFSDCSYCSDWVTSTMDSDWSHRVSIVYGIPGCARLLTSGIACYCSSAGCLLFWLQNLQALPSPVQHSKQTPDTEPMLV